LLSGVGCASGDGCEARSAAQLEGVKGNFSSPGNGQASENHPILPPSFNQHEKEKNDMCQIASQPCITEVKRIRSANTQIFSCSTDVGGCTETDKQTNKSARLFKV